MMSPAIKGLVAALCFFLYSQGCVSATDGGKPGTDAGFCSQDKDCAEGMICKEGICAAKPQCTKQTELADCGIYKFCNTLTLKCEFYEGFGDACSAPNDCEFGFICDRGLCRESGNPCSSDADCGSDEHCSKDFVQCVKNFCVSDAHCGEGENCDEQKGECVVKQDECSAQTEERDCGSGMRCSPEGKCVQCLEDDDCGPNLKCKTETNQCVSGNYCDSDEDCLPRGLVCMEEQHICGQPPPDGE